HLGQESERQWDGRMRSYRVWEAARKVFMYPENWIEPELRRTKSQFFEELEAELLQDDVTDARAAQAVVAYLDKLRPLGNPKIVGLFHEVGSDGDLRIDRFHVFGQVRGTPATTWYRVFNLLTGTWTPWERLDIDIKESMLCPVVFSGRLIVFWTEVTV